MGEMSERIDTLRQWKDDAVAAKNKAEANLQELRGKCMGLLEALKQIGDSDNYWHATDIDGANYAPPITCCRHGCEPDEIAQAALDAYKRKGESDE